MTSDSGAKAQRDYTRASDTALPRAFYGRIQAYRLSDGASALPIQQVVEAARTKLAAAA